jgi:hypothetical protein
MFTGGCQEVSKMRRAISAFEYPIRAIVQGFVRGWLLLCAAVLMSHSLAGCSSREIARPTEVKPDNAVVLIGIANATPELETDIVATWENIWESKSLHGSFYTTQPGLRLYELPPGTYRLYQSVAFSRPMPTSNDNYTVFTVQAGEAVYVGTFAYRFVGQRARSISDVLIGPAASNDGAQPAAFSVTVRDEFSDAVEIYNRLADGRAPVLVKRLAQREYIPCLPRPTDGKRTTTYPRGAPTFEQRCPEGKARPDDPRRRVVR